MIDYYSYFPSIVSSPRYHFAAISLRLQSVSDVSINPPTPDPVRVRDSPDAHRPALVVALVSSLSSSLSRVAAAVVSLARSLARFKESGSKPIRWNYHRIGAPNFVRSIERAPTSTFAFASAGSVKRTRARGFRGRPSRRRVPTDGRRRRRRRVGTGWISASARSDIRNIRVLFITHRRNIHGIRMRAVDLMFYKSPLNVPHPGVGLSRRF